MVKHFDRSIQHIYINTTFAALKNETDKFYINF